MGKYVGEVDMWQSEMLAILGGRESGLWGGLWIVRQYIPYADFKEIWDTPETYKLTITLDDLNIAGITGRDIITLKLLGWFYNDTDDTLRFIEDN